MLFLQKKTQHSILNDIFMVFNVLDSDGAIFTLVLKKMKLYTFTLKKMTRQKIEVVT